MEPQEALIGVAIFIGFGVGLLLGLIWIDQTADIGQMVCEENGFGDYVSFDSSSKTIKCEPTIDKFHYDSGYIEIGYKGD